MSFIIRAAVESDAADLARIAAATFAMACPASTPQADLDAHIASELTPQRFIDHMNCVSRSLFVVVVDGLTAGYLMLCRDEIPPEIGSESALELRRIYVLAEFHGGGIAQALMEQALGVARSEQRARLWLSVSKHNARGIRFYQKNGFTVVGEQIFPVGKDLHEDYLMARSVIG